nr:hypothetical protein [Tanacetum cinerariifolium]
MNRKFGFPFMGIPNFDQERREKSFSADDFFKGRFCGWCRGGPSYMTVLMYQNRDADSSGISGMKLELTNQGDAISVSEWKHIERRLIIELDLLE